PGNYELFPLMGKTNLKTGPITGGLTCKPLFTRVTEIGLLGNSVLMGCFYSPPLSLKDNMSHMPCFVFTFEGNRHDDKIPGM
ncbi:MAG: hypothetical protein K2Y08_07105, partial [Alphaproteobacteria bacterium]|nr:hypothetical protein [Alphaproteobacteria bacterium]